MADPDGDTARERAGEVFVKDLRAAYARGVKAGTAADDLAALLLTYSYSLLHLTFNLDEEHFWRMVADTARRYVVDGVFEAARENQGDSESMH